MWVEIWPSEFDHPRLAGVENSPLRSSYRHNHRFMCVNSTYLRRDFAPSRESCICGECPTILLISGIVLSSTLIYLFTVSDLKNLTNSSKIFFSSFVSFENDSDFVAN